MGVLSVGSVLLAMSTATPAAAPAADAQAAPLLLRPKAAIAATAAPRGAAPFAIATDAVDLDFPKPVDPRLAASPSSCSGQRSLCYDPGSGRIVYKPARQLMPSLPGFTPESISLKRDRITLRYSF
jgi:hypothetical protein